MFGNIAAVARGQGSNILLNIFFGTVVNAAYGVSLQVNSAVKQFVSNFQVALNPQIIKTYAQGNHKQNHKLIFQGSKLSFFLLFLIACPVWINIDFILSVWLENPPKYTAIFIRLAIISLLIDSISGPLMIGIQSTGKVKWYQIVVGSVILLDLPITYFVLKFFQKPEYSYLVTISITSVALFIRLFFLRKLINFNIKDFFKEVLFKLFLIFLISFSLLYVVKTYMVINEEWFSFLFESIIAFVINIGLVIFLGFDKNEKLMLKNVILKKIGKN